MVANSTTHASQGLKAGQYAYRRGCRCPDCREAHRKKAQREKINRMSIGRTPKTHGASTYGNWGCRCEVCSEAHSKVMRRNYERRKREVQGVR